MVTFSFSLEIILLALFYYYKYLFLEDFLNKINTTTINKINPNPPAIISINANNGSLVLESSCSIVSKVEVLFDI